MNMDETKKFIKDYLARVLGSDTTIINIGAVGIDTTGIGIVNSLLATIQVNIIDKVTNKSYAFYLTKEFLETNSTHKTYIFISDKLVMVCKEIQKMRLHLLFPKGVPIDLLMQQEKKGKPMSEAYEGPPVIVSANHTITVYSAGKKLDATFKPKKDITAYQLSVAMFLLNGDYLGSALEMIAESDMIEHWEIQG